MDPLSFPLLLLLLLLLLLGGFGDWRRGRGQKFVNAPPRMDPLLWGKSRAESVQPPPQHCVVRTGGPRAEGVNGSSRPLEGPRLWVPVEEENARAHPGG